MLARGRCLATKDQEGDLAVHERDEAFPDVPPAVADAVVTKQMLR